MPRSWMQVGEQLHFVQAVEVRELGRRAGFDLHFPRGADEVREAADEHDLFAVEIAFGFDLERGRDHAGAAAADGGAVGVAQALRRRRVLRDRDDAPAGRRRCVNAARSAVPGPFGATMATFTSAGGLMKP